MKLLRLTTNYHNYLDFYYKFYSDLKLKDYNTQYKSLMYDSFGWSDVWTDSLTKLGYEVWEPVANAEFQQKQWAKENSINYNEKNWMLDITTNQIEKFSPDILFINDYHSFTYEFIKEIRDKIPSIKLVIGWCGAPFSDSSVFKAYDLILTNLPSHKETFSKYGYHVEMMKHAFDPRILNRISINKTNEFTFLGSVIKGNNFHNERMELLSSVSKKIELKLYADLFPSSYNVYRKIKIKHTLKDFLGKLFNKENNFSKNAKNFLYQKLNLKLDYGELLNKSHPSNLLKIAYPGLFGLKMYEKIGNSLLTLNQHIDISKNSSNNMRLYESSGVGTCLITDYTDDLNEKFELDYEIVSYKNIDELIDKVRYLKVNPKVANEIGLKAQKRTLKENTFSMRADWLNELIKKKLNFKKKAK